MRAKIHELRENYNRLRSFVPPELLVNDNNNNAYVCVCSHATLFITSYIYCNCIRSDNVKTYCDLEADIEQLMKEKVAQCKQYDEAMKHIGTLTMAQNEAKKLV